MTTLPASLPADALRIHRQEMHLHELANHINKQHLAAQAAQRGITRLRRRADHWRKKYERLAWAAPEAVERLNQEDKMWHEHKKHAHEEQLKLAL